MKNFILEAPTGEGPEFTKDLEPKYIPSDKYKDFYLKNKLPGDSDRLNKAAEIIVNVKKFLLSNPNKIYPLDYKSFRDEVARIVKETFPVIGSADAGYCARKIQDYLIDSKILTDERTGFRVDHPIKTIEVAKKIEKSLAPVLDKIKHTDKEHDLEALEGDDEDFLEPEDEGWIRPPFNANEKYEKYGDKFKEDSLTEEEQDALDIFGDNDTGSTIIEKLHAARRFKTKSIKEIHALVETLIKKNAIQPVGGYQFDVETDELPAYSQQKREERQLTPEKSMYKKDENLIYEVYKNAKNIKIVNKTFGLGLGNKAKAVNENFFTRLGNRALTNLGSSAAKGRLQAEKSANSLYRVFLQQAAHAGYTGVFNHKIPGNFMISWLEKNVDENIPSLSEAQNINNSNKVENPQEVFNNILRASYGEAATRKTQPNQFIQTKTNSNQAQPKASAVNISTQSTPAIIDRADFNKTINTIVRLQRGNIPAAEASLRSLLKKSNIDVI
jgi:type II secretory pathway pseudopilin PulG